MAASASFADTRSTASSFDHTRFPDAVFLRVRHRNFVVSASYLSLRSSFFHHLFAAPIDGSSTFHLDVNPDIFENLLNMIYPCDKNLAECIPCATSFTSHFNLSLFLKLRCLNVRLIKYSKSIPALEVIAVQALYTYDEYENYQNHLNTAQLHVRPPALVHRVSKRDIVSLLPVASLSDAVEICLSDDKSLFISSSELSLFSRKFYRSFYNLDLPPNHPEYGSLIANRQLTLDMSFNTFNDLMFALHDIFPEEASAQLLNALYVNEMERVRERYVMHLKQELYGCTFIQFDKVLLNYVSLLDHFQLLGILNLCTFDQLTCALSSLEVDRVLAETAPQSARFHEAFRERASTRRLLSLDVVFMHSKVGAVKVQCTDSSTLQYFAHFASKLTKVPTERYRICTSDKRPLEFNRSLAYYGISDGHSIVIQEISG